jgi:hypothetical protein
MTRARPAKTSPTTRPHWSRALARLKPCPEAVTWARTQRSLKVAWAKCERGDWMLWFVGKTCAGKPWSDARKPLVVAACACARLALPYTRDQRALAAIKVAERWAHGKATPAEVDSAASAAADARTETLQQCAVIVRRHYPRAPRLGAR